MRARFRWQIFALRLWRVALLAAAVWAVRHVQPTEMPPLDVTQVRDFFPDAAALSAQDDGYLVLDATGATLGRVLQTAPEADDIIGYSGPTNTLIALDPLGRVAGLRILRSGDTSDHVAEMVRQRRFFKQFTDKSPAALMNLRVDAVSGATLTSSAVAEGVLHRLGKNAAASLRFPAAITLAEVQKLEPQAATLRESTAHPGLFEILDAKGHVIAQATRTAPDSDGVIGYQGPSDTFMLLDATGSKLRALALRRSYDTEVYVGYVTGDPAFLKTFDGMALAQIASIDFNATGIEGVSGATQTSYGVAEGVRVRAQSLLKENEVKRGLWTRLRWRWQDTGHVVLILAALLMAFTPLRGRAWCRHLHHGLLVVYAGFIAGEMLSQGLFAGWSLHGPPWRSAPGLVLLAVTALLAPVFTGRQLYCHHICPHGALQQLVMRRVPFQWSPPKRLEAVLSSVPFILLAFVLGCVALALPVNLNALEPFDAYVFRVAGWASITIALLGLLWSLITPMAYCRYGCPTGALFKLLRSAGEADRFGLRDWLSAAGVAVVVLFARG